MELIYMVVSGLFAFVACYMAARAHTYMDSAKWAEEKAKYSADMAKSSEHRLYGADAFNKNN